MHKKVLALILATVLIGGCDSSGESLESKGSSDRTVIPSEIISDLQQNAPQNSESTTEPQSDSSADITNNNISEESAPVETGCIHKEIADYVNSLDNGDFVFVDYAFDDEPETITDVSLLSGVYDKALAVLEATDDYRCFAENFTSAELFGRFTENAENFLDENDKPTPIFKWAVTDDFDRDGTEEHFIAAAMPVLNGDGEERWFERELLIFVGKNGAYLLDNYYNTEINAVLDYGCCKQIAVTSEGWSGTDSKSCICGVQDGNAVKLYSGRLTFSKTDCFLYSAGPQYIGDFAVYDIHNGEHLAIRGKELSVEDIRAMDTDNIIRSAYNNSAVDAVLLGGKYFLIGADGVWTYENDRFERSDKRVRRSVTPGYTGDTLNTLADVDYNVALASMATPEEVLQSERQ